MVSCNLYVLLMRISLLIILARASFMSKTMSRPGLQSCDTQYKTLIKCCTSLRLWLCDRISLVILPGTYSYFCTQANRVALQDIESTSLYSQNDSFPAQPLGTVQATALGCPRCGHTIVWGHVCDLGSALRCAAH